MAKIMRTQMEASKGEPSAPSPAPPPETFITFAERLIARTQSFFARSDVVGLPAKLPDRIKNAVPLDLRKRLAELWLRQLKWEAEIEAQLGPEAMRRERDREQAELLNDPLNAKIPRDHIKLREDLTRRRIAITAKFADEHGEEFFATQDAAIPLLLAAIEAEARLRIDDDCREASDLGLDHATLPVDICSLSLLRLYVHACNVKGQLDRQRAQWDRRKVSFGNITLYVDARLLLLLGIAKPTVKAP